LYSDIGDYDIYQLDTRFTDMIITLPPISSLENNKRIHTFTDVGGFLDVHPLTIQATGTNVIANGTDILFTMNYSSSTYASNCNNRWLII
jgi:hypothetical protein